MQWVRSCTSGSQDKDGCIRGRRRNSGGSLDPGREILRGSLEATLTRVEVGVVTACTFVLQSKVQVPRRNGGEEANNQQQESQLHGIFWVRLCWSFGRAECWDKGLKGDWRGWRQDNGNRSNQESKL